MSATRVRPYPHFKFPDEIVISFKRLDQSACDWHGVKQGSYELRCDNYGWFPTDILMGVVNRKYCDTRNIGAKISGNMGTAGISVIDIDLALQLLKESGYNIK